MNARDASLPERYAPQGAKHAVPFRGPVGADPVGGAMAQFDDFCRADTSVNAMAVVTRGQDAVNVMPAAASRIADAQRIIKTILDRPETCR